MREMGWKNEVNAIIQKICASGETFNLSDLYEYKDYLEKLYPNNNHITDKIRQTLQYLRDEAVVEFLDDNGNYKRIK